MLGALGRCSALARRRRPAGVAFADPAGPDRLRVDDHVGRPGDARHRGLDRRRRLVPARRRRARRRRRRPRVPAGAVPAHPAGRRRRGEPAIAGDVPERRSLRHRDAAGGRRPDARAELGAGGHRRRLGLARPPGPLDEPESTGRRAAAAREVQSSTVPMLVDGNPVTVSVSTTWLAAPSRVPLAVGAAAGLAAVLLALARRARLGVGAARVCRSPRPRSGTGSSARSRARPGRCSSGGCCRPSRRRRCSSALLLGRRLVSYALVLLAALELAVWVWLRRDAAFRAIIPTDAPVLARPRCAGGDGRRRGRRRRRRRGGNVPPARAIDGPVTRAVGGRRTKDGFGRRPTDPRCRGQRADRCTPGWLADQSACAAMQRHEAGMGGVPSAATSTGGRARAAGARARRRARELRR